VPTNAKPVEFPLNGYKKSLINDFMSKKFIFVNEVIDLV